MDGDYSAWMSEEDLSRQTSSYITENTEDSLAFDNRVYIICFIVSLALYLTCSFCTFI